MDVLGYDAAVGCPEGCMRVTPAAYAHLVWSLSSLSAGRLVVMLEGGYCLESLAEGAALTLRTLLGDPAPSLPNTSKIEDSVLKSVAGVTAALRPYWKCMQIRPVSALTDQTRLQFPRIRFRPPPNFPPDKFATRDYYLVFDKETEASLRLELARINLATRSESFFFLWLFSLRIFFNIINTM